MNQHQQLEDVIADQLSLAAIHYLRSHYQEAIDIYKKILLDNRFFYFQNTLYIIFTNQKICIYFSMFFKIELSSIIIVIKIKV